MVVSLVLGLFVVSVLACVGRVGAMSWVRVRARVGWQCEGSGMQCGGSGVVRRCWVLWTSRARDEAPKCEEEWWL